MLLETVKWGFEGNQMRVHSELTLLPKSARNLCKVVVLTYPWTLLALLSHPVTKGWKFLVTGEEQKFVYKKCKEVIRL